MTTADVAAGPTVPPDHEAPEPLYTRKANGRSAPMPLALVFDADLVQPEHVVTLVGWSDAAYQKLGALSQAYRNASRDATLPTASLRARLELADPDNLRLDRGLGLQRDRTVFWTACGPTEATERVSRAVMGWLVDDVEAPDGADALVQQLRGLTRSGGLLSLSRRPARVFAWEYTLGGTASPAASNPQGYPDLADYIARRLEGAELCPDLGPLRRLASSELVTNQAELITTPLADQAEPFSLVLRIKILSYPGRPTPVVEFEVARRLWTRSLRRTGTHILSGYAFPADRHTAVRFTLHPRPQVGADARKTWHYQPGRDYAAIARTFQLPRALTGAEIASGTHQTEACSLYVVHKYGVAQRTQMKYGVPDEDKRLVLRRVTELLEPYGLRQWTALEELETRTRSLAGRNQAWRLHDDEEEARQEQYRQWLAEAKASVSDCYTNVHHLVIGFHPTCFQDAEKARATLTELLDRSVTIEMIRISEEAHGPRSKLPGAEVKSNRERAPLRAQAWKGFIDSVRQYQADLGTPVNGILVIAPKMYENFHAQDDGINKRVARLTLATGLRVPIQYLRPEQEEGQTFRGKTTPAERFEGRMMAAWLDLAWKTLGRVRVAKLARELEHVYGPEPTAHPPDRILAVGILRRNETRHFSDKSFVPYAIELDVARGTCRARFAREQGSIMDVTPMAPLPDTLVELARSGPIQLATDRAGRFNQLKERSEKFFRQVITEFCQSAERPLVLIDADTCRTYWTWVADKNLDPRNVKLDGSPHVEADWGDVNVVRVRTRNAPKVLFDQFYKVTNLVTGEVEDWTYANAADAKVFKVTDAQLPVYLSFGSLIRTSQTLGTSCVQERVSLRKRKAPKGSPMTFERVLQKPRTDAWSTPSGVEFTVVRTAAGATADQVVQVVEWLRTLFEHMGDWSTKPAPLYFERALAEYLADFDTQEDMEEEEFDGEAEGAE